MPGRTSDIFDIPYQPAREEDAARRSHTSLRRPRHTSQFWTALAVVVGTSLASWYAMSLLLARWQLF